MNWREFVSRLSLFLLNIKEKTIVTMLRRGVINISITCIFSVSASATADQTVEQQWFSDNRIQIHTTIGPARRGSLAEFAVNDVVNALGVGAFTRHVKTDWRAPLWVGRTNSNVREHSGVSTNMKSIEKAVEMANQMGISVGAYYWEAGGKLDSVSTHQDNFSEDSRLQNSEQQYLERDWLCKDESGSLIPESMGKKVRGWHADLASPEFRALVLRDLTVIRDLGFSSIFFDERHYPDATQSPCFGSSLEQQFRLEFDEDQPVDLWDADLRAEFIRYQADSMAETFKYWKESLRLTGSVPLFVISGTYLSTLIYPHMSFSLGLAADVIKVEYEHGLRRSLGGGLIKNSHLSSSDDNVRRYLAWIIARDFADGMPPYVWKRTVQSEAHLYSVGASILLHGGVAAFHIPDRLYDAKGLKPRLTNDGKSYIDTPLAVLQEGIQLLNPIADYMSGSHTYSEVEVVLDESTIERTASALERWETIGQPLQMVTQQLYDAGVPFSLTTGDLLMKDVQPKSQFIVIGEVSESVQLHLDQLESGGAVVLRGVPQVVGAGSGFQFDQDTLSGLQESFSNLEFGVYVEQKQQSMSAAATFHTSADGNLLIGLIAAPLDINNPTAHNTYSDIKLVFSRKPHNIALAGRSEPLESRKAGPRSWVAEVPPFSRSTLAIVHFE